MTHSEAVLFLGGVEAEKLAGDAVSTGDYAFTILMDVPLWEPTPLNGRRRHGVAIAPQTDMPGHASPWLITGLCRQPCRFNWTNPTL
jgi:hypothetical protein